MTESWRKLHNEELHNLYYSPNISISKSAIYQIKEDATGRACNGHGGDEKCMQNFDWNL
jgi:hypothetical protein